MGIFGGLKVYELGAQTNVFLYSNPKSAATTLSTRASSFTTSRQLPSIIYKQKNHPNQVHKPQKMPPEDQSQGKSLRMRISPSNIKHSPHSQQNIQELVKLKQWQH